MSASPSDRLAGPALPARGEVTALVRRLDGAPDPLGLYRSVSDDGRRPGTLLFETADTTAGERARSIVLAAAALTATCRGRRVHLEARSPNGECALEHVLARTASFATIEPPPAADGGALPGPRAAENESPSPHGSSAGPNVPLADALERAARPAAPPGAAHRTSRVVTLALPPCSTADDLAERLAAPSPLDVLRAMGSFRALERGTPHAVFCAGVFAYDLIDAFERLPPAASDPLDYPDFTFHLAESLVVLEPSTGHTLVIAASFGSHDPARARAVHGDAAARLAALVDRCRAAARPSRTVFRSSPPDTSTGASPSPAGGAPASPGPVSPAPSSASYPVAAGAERAAPPPPAASPRPPISATLSSAVEGAQVDMDDSAYAAGVTALKEHIARGDVFQIVPSRTFSAPCPSPIGAYSALRAASPGPYMFFFATRDHTLFGSSPETSVRVTRTGPAALEMEIRPIAGTRRRGRDASGHIDADLDNRREAELLLDEKERAEHMMLVDLARNDVARVCRPGTRRVDRLLTVERFSHVMHLVSRVTGALRPDQDALGAVAAAMNMGTLVGAPKVRAAELLRRHEATRRGPYGGSIGYFTGEGELDTAVIIRSALVKGGVAHVRAGAGVVHDSDPLAEADETRRKAAGVLEALRASLEQASSDRDTGGLAPPVPPRVERPAAPLSAAAPLAAPGAPGRIEEVLFVDNFDSFTFNLVDAFERLGCRVRVVRNTASAGSVLAAAREARALVVLSPGPGAPDEAGSCLDILAGAKGAVPVLGVCLGHQAIVLEAGGVVDRADAVVHGKATPLLHDGLGPFRGVPSPLLVGRYHSLATRCIPERLHVHAAISGMAMAVSDRAAMQIGFQFHPESLLTPAGQTLLENVLTFAAERRPS